MDATTLRKRWPIWFGTALLLGLGFALRIVPWTAFDGMGFDESWYRKYLHALDRGGWAVYPEIHEAYLEDGKDPDAIAKVPPTRVLFVVSGWLWKRAAFGASPPENLDVPGGIARDPALVTLHRVATLFGCLGMLVAWGFSRRLMGEIEGLAVLALFACAPLLIHTSQHALIDGICATCALAALWALWESMQPGARSTWLVAYGSAFTLLVLTKESAIFPCFAFAVLMLFGRPLSFGIADRRHWVAALFGGLTAIALLTLAAGDFRTLSAVFRQLIGKVQTLTYAQETGDGPWFRYLVDLMIFTPATLCFAVAGGFRTIREDRRYLGLLAFIAASYLVMCNVRFGMNLRYTSIWEFPLRALVVVQVLAITSHLHRSRLAMASIVAALCALDLTQYHRFFVAHRLYELPTEDLLRVQQMLK